MTPQGRAQGPDLQILHNTVRFQNAKSGVWVASSGEGPYSIHRDSWEPLNQTPESAPACQRSWARPAHQPGRRSSTQAAILKLLGCPAQKQRASSSKTPRKFPGLFPKRQSPELYLCPVTSSVTGSEYCAQGGLELAILLPKTQAC